MFGAASAEKVPNELAKTSGAALRPSTPGPRCARSSKEPRMCDEAYLLVRSPNEPRGDIRRRVRATFVCPSCGWKLQAVLEQELTTVRCECEAQFAVRKPERRHASKNSSPPNLSRPPLRSILQQLAGGAPNRSYSDTDSHASHPSSVQSVMVSHCSSNSSAVVSIKAPSVVSISSASSSVELRPATQATRVKKTLAEREADASTAASSASHEQSRKNTTPAESAPSVSAATWLPLPSIGEGGWLGQMFSNTSLNSP